MNKKTKFSNLNRTLTTFVKTIFTGPARIGSLFAIGFITTSLIAVAVGNLTTWTAGQTLTAKNLNDNFESLRSAVDSIPNWTKGTTSGSAFYTAGNVGIGTVSPSGVLHLQGSTPTVFLQSSTDGTARRLLGLDSSQNLAIYANVNQVIQFLDRDNTTERMRINTGTGNVGIGTTSPANSLHIDATVKTSAPLRLRTATGGYNWIDLVNGIDGNVAWGINDGNANRNLVLYQYNSAGSFVESALEIQNSNGNVSIQRNLNVAGALSKGSGTFDIAHPDPSMPKDSRLRHSFVESPTAGDNIYRWQVKVETDNGKSYIQLPKYWSHLNTNPMVWVSSVSEPALSYSYVNTKSDRVIIQADKIGTYNVLLLGTRKDELAVANWKALGMEYIAKGIGEAEKVLTYQDKVESGPLPIDRMSQKLRTTDVAKKLSNLEEENAELKADRAADKQRIANLEAKLEKMMVAMERQSIGTYARK